MNSSFSWWDWLSPLRSSSSSRSVSAPDARFFATIRANLDAKLSQSQVDGLTALWRASADLQKTWRAYLLATAWHETASTMQPIAEYGRGGGKPYGRPGRYGQAPYGRGYVQLTWDDNYERADAALGLNGALLKNFDLALSPDIAAKIAIRGMSEGWFTGKKFADYLPGDYVGARRIINGTDKAELIAGYASAFEAAL